MQRFENLFDAVVVIDDLFRYCVLLKYSLMVLIKY